ncbi:malonate decarboxylase holo-[acyl-carrier-protein] synthase [Cetobacterium sp.]|uniref:malonate decarboxylase holo-[acyl-carrier-protein] synthase n=1 Tax=Cetobacterium sp. TaxID=2071632 RepID=UPI003EE76B1F
MIRRHDLLIIKNKIIPGIVKRQEKIEPGYIEIGISYPIKIDNQRVREVSRVTLEEIEKIVTPYDILGLYHKKKIEVKVLDELIVLSEEIQIKMGVFGSLALMIYTGLSYFVEDSDIDIIIKKTSNAILDKFYKKILELEDRYNRKIDVEVEIEDGYALKLKEYFKGQKTILLKGFSDAKLVELGRIKNE